jgi:RNA polymerase sigma-70 factor (ECF subfamily)
MDVQLADRELVERAQAGDREALGELLGRHQRQVFRLAARILGRREDALDATQEALLRVCRHLAGVDPARPFGPWIRTVAVRAALDACRRRAARPGAGLDPEALASHAPGPVETTEAGQLAHALGAAFRQLSPAQRAAFACKELEGMDTAETARAMGCMRATVRWHLFEAKRRLAARLGHFRPGQEG